MDDCITLSNGVKMPRIGMGTYPLQGEMMTKAVVAASKFGYRAFDTAYAYGNENSLGESLLMVYQMTDLNRSNIFLTSKIGETLDHGRPDCKLFYASYENERKNIKGIVAKQLDRTLKNLRTDYLDLLLIHWPHPDYLLEIWDAMVDQYRSGRVRAVGVSNCREWHLKRIIEFNSICPMVNQIELHPLNTKKELISYCKKAGIQVEAYSPLLVMKRDLMDSICLKKLSAKYNKTVPQIILRWDIQQQVVPIPKSANPKRLKENIDLFDFSLTEEDMLSIDALNKNFRVIVESKYCPGY